MHKVVTINLNGRAFQLDDDAYDALRAYLDRADAQLKDNPDRTEILTDLEQAIAEKAERFLSPQKTVVSASEVATILREMGPVEGSTSESAAGGTESNTTTSNPKPAHDPNTPRRLYRVMEGAMLGGVCMGLSAFTQVDVTVVRAIMIALAAIEIISLHSGVFLVLYVVMMFVLPEASTQEERAAARGVPFNAQEVVENAQRFGRKLNKDWRRQERAWRRQRRHAKREWQGFGGPHPWWGAPQPTYPIGYGTRLLAGITMPILTILTTSLFWFGAYVVLTLVRAGNAEDWRLNLGVPIALPSGMPLWMGILIVVIVFHMVSWPLHAARRASHYALGGPYHGWFAAWDGLLSLCFGALILWVGYHYVPEVRDMMQHLPEMWDNLRDSFRR